MEHDVCVCVNVTPGTYFAFFLLKSQFVQWRGCWTPCRRRRHGYVRTARCVRFVVIKPTLLRVNTIDALNAAPVSFFPVVLLRGRDGRLGGSLTPTFGEWRDVGLQLCRN